jgi:hypothetical protein
MSDVSVSPPNEPPQRVRLEGKLDMVRASDASFTLIADDGRVIQGRLVGRSIEDLARFLNRGVLVFGTPQFDSLGNLMSVEVDGWLATDYRPPRHRAWRENRRKYGKRWPGDSRRPLAPGRVTRRMSRSSRPCGS